MCGIMGIVSLNGRINLSAVSLRALLNRGPDGSGNYVDRGVGLYHTRLAVIDQKEMSNQPLVNAEADCVVVCNGEIYNYKELQSRYPYAYQTTSDCESILACYCAQGVEGFRSLKGMFSFVLYDVRKNKLFVCRDAVGKKPLFYYEGNGLFICASNVTVLKENIPHALKINPQAVASFMRDGFIDPRMSFYEEIMPIAPGKIFEINTGTLEKLVHTLEPESVFYGDFSYTPKHIADEATRLLTESVERRLCGLKRPVLLFSGGIDSTCLALLLSRFAGSQLTCVGLKPLVPNTYDEPYARIAAKKLKVTYIPVGFDIFRLKEEINLAVSLLDQPFAAPSYYFLTCLTRKSREFGNVLFSGEGGDEVFYGYSDIRSWFKEGVLDDDSLSSCRVGPVGSQALSVWARKQLSLDLLGHSFVKVDKATAEQQMEARCPYLDWDLMCFMRSVPVSYFLERGITKPILKDLLSGFSADFVNRPKVGSAYNFRYLLIPLYRFLFQSICFKELSKLGVAFENERFSYRKFFFRFDYYWRLYVLSRFV